MDGSQGKFNFISLIGIWSHPSTIYLDVSSFLSHARLHKCLSNRRPLSLSLSFLPPKELFLDGNCIEKICKENARSGFRPCDVPSGMH